MNQQECIAELERRVIELERKLTQPLMVRMFGTLMTPEARSHLRLLGSQQLMLMAEISRGLAELISPDQTKPDDAPEERRARQVPID